MAIILNKIGEKWIYNIYNAIIKLITFTKILEAKIDFGNRYIAFEESVYRKKCTFKI